MKSTNFMYVNLFYVMLPQKFRYRDIVTSNLASSLYDELIFLLLKQVQEK